MDDPFVLKYQPSEIKIAAEFLRTWLPFLTRDLCHNCSHSISKRVLSLDQDVSGEAEPLQLKEIQCDCDSDTNSLGSWKESAEYVPEASSSTETTIERESSVVNDSPSVRVSWADMAQEEEELERGEGENENEEEDGGEGENENEEEDGGEVVNEVREEEENKQDLSLDTETTKANKSSSNLTREQREYLRFKNVERKKDFICLERVKGKIVNILEGLELHKGIFSAVEQKRIVNFIYTLQEKGRRGELRERTFSAPKKWMPGKGRETIQFGCCYNYAVLKDGTPPGILREELVDPIPPLFKVMIRRLVGWHVLPPTCVPDSCIVNIYEEGDCIPPHIDHHDFLRPFCTVSFLSQCDIVFGLTLKIEGPGEFSGSFAIPLPVGSVLVLNGNGADVAKHCVPAVPTKRISITFRKMDEKKLPVGFVPERDLQGLQPLPYDLDDSDSMNTPKHPSQRIRQNVRREVYVDNGRGFVDRASRSEPVDVDKGRGFLNRGTRSEPRYSGRTWSQPGSQRRMRISLDM